MDHPHRWVFYKLSGNTSFQRNHSYVPFPNLTHLGVGGTYIYVPKYLPKYTFGKGAVCRPLCSHWYWWVLLVILSVKRVSQGSKMFLQATQSNNAVVLMHLQQGRNCDESSPSAVEARLFHYTYHSHITCKCKKRNTPYKIWGMCCLLSKLKAEYIPLKWEILQRALIWFLTMLGEIR